MGRKIPAKKHRGVKDPEKQQAVRFQKIKNKINAPPKDPDEQPVPRSLTRLFAFQDREKNYGQNKKKVKRLQPQHHDLPSKNPISKLRKLPGESGRSFSLRINSAIKALHDPMETQDYPEDFDEDDMKGERMAAQREKRLRKHKKKMKEEGTSLTPQPTRAEKRALKRKEKKIKLAEKKEQAKPEVQYERVSFGEVAHAPPSLTLSARMKKATDSATVPRPGRRDLLLSKLLPANSSPDKPSKSKKTRDLPAAEQRRLEQARLDAVAAYRALKANRAKENSKNVVNI